MNPTKDKNQYKYMAQKIVPLLDKSGSASKTETEHTDKLDTTKYLYHYPVHMIKKWQDKNQKT